MKSIGKALKLYLKITFNPIVAAFGIFIMIALLIAAAVSPEAPDSEGYMSMIGSVGFGQIGIAAFCLFGSITMSRNKWFASLPFAKVLFTVIPVIVSSVISLIYYNAAITIAALCWEQTALSDLLIFVPINSAVMCLAVSAIGKPKLEWIYLICVLFLGTQQAVLPNISATAHGLGLQVLTAGIIGGLIYIAGIAISLLITALWWKKCDHTYRGNVNIIKINKDRKSVV